MSGGADWSDLTGGGRRSGGWRPRLTSGVSMPVGTGRWVLRAVLAVGALAGVVGGGLLVTAHWTPLLPVERVQIDGPLEYADDAALGDAVAPFLHDSMMRVDIRGARRALEAQPWVAAAAVRRAWPDTVRIEVREREPMAYWIDGSDAERAMAEAGADGASPRVLVDRGGQRFEPPQGSIPEGLPRLIGPDGAADQVVERFRRLNRLFDDAGVNMAALARSPRGSWDAELDEGTRIALGRDAPEERMARFVDALPTLRNRRDDPMDRVDLRHPNGFAIAWGESEDTN